MEEPLFETASTVRKRLTLVITKESARGSMAQRVSRPMRTTTNLLKLNMSTSLKRVETHKINRLVEKKIQRSGGGGNALQRSVRGLAAL
jgi:hypothetical protein